MTQKQLKESLDALFTNYKRHFAALSRSVNEPSSSIRALKSKIETFEKSLDSLNMAHTAWVSKAELSPENLKDHTYSTEWLEQRWFEADDILDQAKDMLLEMEEKSKPPTLQPNQKVIILTEQIEALKSSISHRTASLAEQVSSKSVSSSAHPILSNMLVDAKAILNTEYRDLAKSVIESSAGKDDLSEIVKSLEQFRLLQETQIVAIELDLANSAPPISTSCSLPPTSVSTPVGRGHKIEMEKCKVPTFDGDTIAYPEFKRSWQKVAGSNWDEDNQLEQLKFKVDSHTKRIISRCRTMTEVWAALDNEYAQEEEIVNAVNAQLKKLKSADCSTSEYIVSLRNHIPVLESALESANGLEHLQTPDKENFLVDKFDSLMQRDWEYYKSKNSGKTWDRFFAFILDRYDACRSTIARLRSQESDNDSSQKDSGLPSLKPNATSASCVKCKKWIAKGGAYLCP